jgi:hypothetical protein
MSFEGGQFHVPVTSMISTMQHQDTESPATYINNTQQGEILYIRGRLRLFSRLNRTADVFHNDTFDTLLGGIWLFSGSLRLRMAGLD